MIGMQNGSKPAGFLHCERNRSYVMVGYDHQEPLHTCIHKSSICSITEAISREKGFTSIELDCLSFAGATREIGACLTRIVLRHKSMESKLKALCR